MGSRALRVGAAAILCALTLRLFASGLPGKLLSWLTSPDTAAFLIYLETGRGGSVGSGAAPSVLF